MTLTTVGYGDVFPVTPEGRLAGGALMIVGITLFAAITGTITSFLVVEQASEREGRIDVPGLLHVLAAACEAWDRAEEARQRIAADGPYLADRFGQLKPHPALAVERDGRVAFLRSLRELSLDAAPPDPRPPRRRN